MFVTCFLFLETSVLIWVIACVTIQQQKSTTSLFSLTIDNHQPRRDSLPSINFIDLDSLNLYVPRTFKVLSPH